MRDMVRRDGCRCRTRKNRTEESKRSIEWTAEWHPAAAQGENTERVKLSELHHCLEVKPNWIGLYIIKDSSRSTRARRLRPAISYSSAFRHYRKKLSMKNDFYWTHRSRRGGHSAFKVQAPNWLGKLYDLITGRRQPIAQPLALLLLQLSTLAPL